MQYKDKMRAPQRTKPTQNLDIQSTLSVWWYICAVVLVYRKEKVTP